MEVPDVRRAAKGEEWLWVRALKQEKVRIEATPLMLMEKMNYPEPGEVTEFPGPVLQCEVMVLATGRRDYARVADLRPIKST